jgi:hypothetical protein
MFASTMPDGITSEPGPGRDRDRDRDENGTEAGPGPRYLGTELLVRRWGLRTLRRLRVAGYPPVRGGPRLRARSPQCEAHRSGRQPGDADGRGTAEQTTAYDEARRSRIGRNLPG